MKRNRLKKALLRINDDLTKQSWNYWLNRMIDKSFAPYATDILELFSFSIHLLSLDTNKSR